MELDEETSALASGTLWQNIGQIAVKLVSFIYTILIARLVAPDEVGLFYFALGLIGVISIFADFGLSQTVQRYVPFYLGKKDKMSAARVLVLSIVLSTLMVAIVALITYAGTPLLGQIFGNPQLGPLMLLFAVYLCVNQTFNIASSTLTALKIMKERSLGSNLQNVLKVLLTIALIMVMGPTARALTIAFILSFIIGTVYLLWALHRALTRLNLPATPGFGWYPALLWETLPFGLTLLSISMFSTLLAYTDRVIIGFILQAGAAVPIAIYSMASNLASVTGLLASSVITILLPVASGLVSQNDPAKISKAAWTAMRWVLFSTIPVLAFIVAFSNPLLFVLYGTTYVSGAVCLALFSLGSFFFILGSVPGTLIAAHRLVRLELSAFIAAALLNVVLNLVLIPPFGINGASFASMLSFALLACINYGYAHQRLGFRLSDSFPRHLLAGLLLAGFMFLLAVLVYAPLSSLIPRLSDGSLVMGLTDKVFQVAILSVFTGLDCLAYLVLLNLLHLFEHEDRQVLKSILAKAGVPPAWSERLARGVFWRLAKE